MKRLYAIYLIACFVLLVDNNGVTEGHSFKKLFRAFAGLKQLKSLQHGILPGTLWCGRGDIARDDSELGTYRELDMCCRAHDYCEDVVNPKSTKYGLHNKHICVLSLCECDVEFYDCLKQVNGLYASFVGQIYFTNCKRCFRTYYDSQECMEKGLDISEEKDSKDRRVFCAKFDRNPKWGQRHNKTMSESISTSELPIWDDDDDDDDEPEDFDSRSYFTNNGKHPIEEDDIIYDYYKAFTENND